jgi:O-antigen ligase
MTFVFALMMLCIPLGPTLKSITLGLSVATIILTPKYRQQCIVLLSEPLTHAILIICCMAILACFWSNADLTAKISMVEKYGKLLYLPLLAIGFTHKNTRTLGINAFLIGMLITCGIAFFKLTQHAQEIDHPFYNHIVTSYMMALAAYLAGFLTLNTTGYKKFIYLSMVIIFSIYIFFINIGRTGYFLYFILFCLLVMQNCSFKQMAIIVLLSTISFTMLAYKTTGIFSQGMYKIIENIQDYQHGKKDSPIGFRIQFHHYARTLFLSSPWIGKGTGGFSAHYMQDKPIPNWVDELPNAHSQYWLIASEFGILGFIVFIYFFINLFKISLQLHAMKPIFYAIIIPFMLANLSDTLLVTSGIGYLFVVFCALCLGEYLEQKTTPSTVSHNLAYSA